MPLPARLVPPGPVTVQMPQRGGAPFSKKLLNWVPSAGTAVSAHSKDTATILASPELPAASIFKKWIKQKTPETPYRPVNLSQELVILLFVGLFNYALVHLAVVISWQFRRRAFYAARVRVQRRTRGRSFIWRLYAAHNLLYTPLLKHVDGHYLADRYLCFGTICLLDRAACSVMTTIVEADITNSFLSLYSFGRDPLDSPLLRLLPNLCVAVLVYFVVSKTLIFLTPAVKREGCQAAFNKMQSQVDLHARGIFGDVLHAPTPPTISESAWCSGSDIMQSSLSFDDISELLPGAYEQDDVHELKDWSMIFSDDDNNTSDLESNDFIRSLGNYSFNEEFVGVDEPMITKQSRPAICDEFIEYNVQKMKSEESVKMSSMQSPVIFCGSSPEDTTSAQFPFLGVLDTVTQAVLTAKDLLHDEQQTSPKNGVRPTVNNDLPLASVDGEGARLSQGEAEEPIPVSQTISPFRFATSSDEFRIRDSSPFTTPTTSRVLQVHRTPKKRKVLGPPKNQDTAERILGSDGESNMSSVTEKSTNDMEEKGIIDTEREIPLVDESASCTAVVENESSGDASTPLAPSPSKPLKLERKSADVEENIFVVNPSQTCSNALIQSPVVGSEWNSIRVNVGAMKYLSKLPPRTRVIAGRQRTHLSSNLPVPKNSRTQSAPSVLSAGAPPTTSSFAINVNTLSWLTPSPGSGLGYHPSYEVSKKISSRKRRGRPAATLAKPLLYAVAPEILISSYAQSHQPPPLPEGPVVKKARTVVPVITSWPQGIDISSAPPEIQLPEKEQDTVKKQPTPESGVVSVKENESPSTNDTSRQLSGDELSYSQIGGSNINQPHSKHCQTWAAGAAPLSTLLTPTPPPLLSRLSSSSDYFSKSTTDVDTSTQRKGWHRSTSKSLNARDSLLALLGPPLLTTSSTASSGESGIDGLPGLTDASPTKKRKSDDQGDQGLLNGNGIDPIRVTDLDELAGTKKGWGEDHSGSVSTRGPTVLLSFLSPSILETSPPVTEHAAEDIKRHLKTLAAPAYTQESIPGTSPLTLMRIESQQEGNLARSYPPDASTPNAHPERPSPMSPAIVAPRPRAFVKGVASDHPGVYLVRPRAPVPAGSFTFSFGVQSALDDILGVDPGPVPEDSANLTGPGEYDMPIVMPKDSPDSASVSGLAKSETRDAATDVLVSKTFANMDGTLGHSSERETGSLTRPCNGENGLSPPMFTEQSAPLTGLQLFGVSQGDQPTIVLPKTSTPDGSPAHQAVSLTPPPLASTATGKTKTQFLPFGCFFESQDGPAYFQSRIWGVLPQASTATVSCDNAEAVDWSRCAYKTGYWGQDQSQSQSQSERDNKPANIEDLTFAMAKMKISKQVPGLAPPAPALPVYAPVPIFERAESIIYSTGPSTTFTNATGTRGYHHHYHHHHYQHQTGNRGTRGRYGHRPRAQPRHIPPPPSNVHENRVKWAGPWKRALVTMTPGLNSDGLAELTREFEPRGQQAQVHGGMNNNVGGADNGSGSGTEESAFASLVYEVSPSFWKEDGRGRMYAIAPAATASGDSEGRGIPSDNTSSTISELLRGTGNLAEEDDE